MIPSQILTRLVLGQIFYIKIILDKASNLTMGDSGISVTKNELFDNFGTIVTSDTWAAMEGHGCKW